MFGFSKIGEGVCNPRFSTTGSSVTQSVPEAQSGDRYTVCVVFINNECMERVDDTIKGERKILCAYITYLFCISLQKCLPIHSYLLVIVLSQ